MKNLNNMVTAPLDGGHIMIVFMEINTQFRKVDTFKIREAWLKTSMKSGISDKFEYLDDYGEFVEIEQPIGWFEIPENFEVDHLN